MTRTREVSVRTTVLLSLLTFAGLAHGEEPTDLFNRGEAVSLDGVIPANERGIVCLAVDDRGRILGGTTGRAAHIFAHDPATGKTRSLMSLGGGIGCSFGLVRLADGSFVVGTQADPTRL